MCDCDAPSAFFRKIRRARAVHQCCECNENIEPGNHYEYVSGVWESIGMSFKTCLRCAGVRKYYEQECLPTYECPPCFTHLWDDLAQSGPDCDIPAMTEAATLAGYL
jgi:hypothetical protein